MKKILTVIGTRPEAIKLIPLIKALNNNSILVNKICLTGQHESISEMLSFNYNINIDYIITPLKIKSSIPEFASHLLLHFSDLLEKQKPDLLIVHGDTTSAFIATLAGFYTKINVAHIEAGLRTENLNSPWPEEAHRVLIDKICAYYFVPTIKAKDNLIKEGVTQNNIWVVGNTSIDALRTINQVINFDLNPARKTIVVTIHRRENQGDHIISICKALKLIAEKFPDILIIFYLHPNPSIQNSITDILKDSTNVRLLQPEDHLKFVQALKQCLFIITDSGGIQEEATFLGKPVLIARDITERTELLDCGLGILTGTKTNNIFKQASMLLKDPKVLSKISNSCFPYGDGYAADRIVSILEQIL